MIGAEKKALPDNRKRQLEEAVARMFSLAACRRNNQQAANLWMRRTAMHSFGMMFRNLFQQSLPSLSWCWRIARRQA
jgi:hypothetical protein